MLRQAHDVRGGEEAAILAGRRNIPPLAAAEVGPVALVVPALALRLPERPQVAAPDRRPQRADRDRVEQPRTVRRAVAVSVRRGGSLAG